MTHLIHFNLNPRRFGAWSATRSPRGAEGGDPQHMMHVLLSALFGKGLAQPFRLFEPQTGDWSVYAHSVMSAEELARTANLVGTPEMLSIISIGDMWGKPLPTQVPAGTRIGFDVRLSPMMRTEKAEQDAYAAMAKQLFPDDPDGMARAGLTREGVYRDWFAKRLEGAGELEEVRMSSFRRVPMFRSGHRFTAPEIVLHGDLRVTDPERFRALHHHGVGRGKAYGFGLLLLRPARPVRPN